MIWLLLMIFPMDLAHKNRNCFMNHRIREVGEENDGLGHPALLPDSAAGFLFRKKNTNILKISIYSEVENKNAPFKRGFKNP